MDDPTQSPSARGACKAAEQASRPHVSSARVSVGRSNGARASADLAATGRIMSAVAADRVPYSSHTGLRIAERLLIAGLRAQERADEAETAHGRLAFLLKASQRMAQSLEPSAVLQSLLDVLVPEIADAATLHTLGSDGRAIRTSAAAEALAERSPEWWRWLDRLTTSSSRRATRLGKSVQATAPRRRSRVVSIDTQVSYMVVPLHVRGRTLGALSLVAVPPRRGYRHADLSAAKALATQASLALENAMAYQQERVLVARLEEERGQLDAAQSEWLRDDERRRIARDLHDMVEQTFFAIGLTATAALDSRSGEPTTADLRDVLRRTAELSTMGAEHLRGAIFGLKQPDYSALRLVPLLRNLLHSFQQRTGVETDLVLSGTESPISREFSETLHAITREALANVERHAHARSVVVTLQMAPRSVRLTVHDDGTGASKLVLKRLGSSALHFGLAGLRERVRQLHGSFTAGPGPDGGFLVRARLPLPNGARA